MPGPGELSFGERLRRSFTQRLPYKLAALFFAVILWLVANERRLLRTAFERATVPPSLTGSSGR